MADRAPARHRTISLVAAALFALNGFIQIYSRGYVGLFALGWFALAASFLCASQLPARGTEPRGQTLRHPLGLLQALFTLTALVCFVAEVVRMARD